MKINENLHALVLNNGTISCISAHTSSIKRAMKSQNYMGNLYEAEAKEVVITEVNGKKKIDWVVVAGGLDFGGELSFNTRSEARSIVRYDKITGTKSHIERREYMLVDSKKVS